MIEQAVEESVNCCQEFVNLTAHQILDRLEKRVSVHNAKLILDSAMVVSGVKRPINDPLEKEEVKCLCLELIRKGGPAFQVGSAVYREVLQ